LNRAVKCRQGKCVKSEKGDEAIFVNRGGNGLSGFAGGKQAPLAATLDEFNKAAKKIFNCLRQAHVLLPKVFPGVSIYLEPAHATGGEHTNTTKIKAAPGGAGGSGFGGVIFFIWPLSLDLLVRGGGFRHLARHLGRGNPDAVDRRLHLDVNVGDELLGPAEVCNLSELAQPLFALVDSLQAPGAGLPTSIITPAGVAHSSRTVEADLARAGRAELGLGPPAAPAGCASTLGTIGCFTA